MELKEFISGTIQQITDGILEGNKYVMTTSNSVEGVRSQYTKIMFDIGVTVSEEDKGEIGSKVSVVEVFKIGGSKSKASHSTSENRISFEIFININTGKNI